MQKLFIERRASDNKYLHRDFHIAFDRGLRYLAMKYGGAAVEEYLAGFARDYYAPLIANAKTAGFAALAGHLKGVYAAEEAADDLRIDETANNMNVCVRRCPAVTYMRGAGYEPSEWFALSTSVIYKTVAAEAGLGFSMVSRDNATGAAEFRFYQTEGVNA